MSPKHLNDALANEPMSPQRRYQASHRRDRLCVNGPHKATRGAWCEECYQKLLARKRKRVAKC